VVREVEDCMSILYELIDIIPCTYKPTMFWMLTPRVSCDLAGAMGKKILHLAVSCTIYPPARPFAHDNAQTVALEGVVSLKGRSKLIPVLGRTT